MRDARDETRALIEFECPCEPELHEVGGNREGDRSKVRRLPFKHDARGCPERVAWVTVIRRDVPYIADLRRPTQGALDLAEHPAPEVSARLIEDGDPSMPSATEKFVAKADRHGWHVLVHYARGTPLNMRKPRPVDSYRVTARSDDDGSAVVALWVDGRFNVAYGVDGKAPVKLSAAQASAWLTGARPEKEGE